MKILLIEDNQIISRQIGEFLAGHHWQVDFAHNARLGIQLALEHIYDVILLDLNLPDLDGLAVCQEIKRNANVTPPVLVITARDSFEDKVAGFQHGGDDYMTKPFDLRELALRCKALARRQLLHKSKTTMLGELTLDARSKTVMYRTLSLGLTSIGYQILEMLVHSYPEPVSRAYITHQLWGDSPPETDALKSHIYALRKTLSQSFGRQVLTTVMNVGYKLEHITHAD
jgi:DNA-binding response OmpR family regulator